MVRRVFEFLSVAKFLSFREAFRCPRIIVYTPSFFELHVDAKFLSFRDGNRQRHSGFRCRQGARRLYPPLRTRLM